MKWERWKLGELCRLEKGIYPTLKTEPGPYPLVVTADFRRSASTYQIEGPAVCVPLISSTGHGDAALHRVHYQDGRFALANLLVALLPRDKSICDAKYLYHLLMARKDDYFVPLMMGTANVSLKQRDIAAVEIHLPPLEYQQRTVSLIEAVSARCNEARRLREIAYKEFLDFSNAIERRFWPAESFAGAPTLEEVTTFLSRGRQAEQGESAHYLIKTQHVQMKHYVRSSLTLSRHVVPKVAKDAIVRSGDILIACSAAGCLGRVALFNEPDQVASTDTHVAIARANEEVILPEYLYAYLTSAQGQVQLRSRERGNWQKEKIGFRLSELNLSDLRRVPVPLPTIPEQRRVVAKFGELQGLVDKVVFLQSGIRADLDAFLPTVSNRVFKS